MMRSPKVETRCYTLASGIIIIIIIIRDSFSTGTKEWTALSQRSSARGQCKLDGGSVSIFGLFIGLLELISLHSHYSSGSKTVCVSSRRASKGACPAHTQVIQQRIHAS
jgi:hypothetical protein